MEKTTIEAFKANDGTLFTTESDCIKYEKGSAIPVMLKNPDFSGLQGMAKKYMEERCTQDHVDDDWKQYMFEELMTACYGLNIFDILNKKE